jgi:hypothetical protein
MEPIMGPIIALQAASFPGSAAGRAVWLLFRMLGSAIARVFSALVNFWNIPVLGADESCESQYFRTGRHG